MSVIPLTNSSVSPLLQIRDLKMHFPVKEGIFMRTGKYNKAVDGVSFDIMPGETLGLVGESGCGKSTVALAVMRDLGKNGKIVGGAIKFKGRDLTKMSEEELRHLRGSEIAMIYQEPMASLNPAMKIGAQLAEVPMIHQGMAKDEAWKLARQIVDQIADFRKISSFVLGKYARVLTPAQRQRFEVAFKTYAQRLFQTQMASFKGDQLKVTGSAVRAPGDSVVTTLVTGDKSAGPLVVSWRVLGAGAGFKVVDVQTRGVWLAITLQQDFVSTIDNAGGSVEALIQRLESGDGR